MDANEDQSVDPHSIHPGWKDFHKPDAAFAPHVGPDGALAARIAAVFLCFAWTLYGSGCVWTLIAYPVTGDGKLAINIGLWGAMAGWALLWVALPLYARAQWRHLLAKRDVIPALSQPRSRPIWFWLVFWGPICVASMGTGLLGTIVVFLERANRVRLSIEYVAGGRLRKCEMWAPRHSDPQLFNAEIWVTRPRLFAPPRAVDRYASPNRLDFCTIPARDWLHHAFYRAINRRDTMRTIKRRARAIARVRHDVGRGRQYR